MVIWGVLAKLQTVARMALRRRRRRWWVVHVSILMHFIAEEAEGDVGDEDGSEEED